jgi:hypothetical protein
MIKVSNELTVYEEDGKDTAMIDGPKIRVLSHWNDPDRVVLVIGEKKLTVIARDLEAAITNATNTRRH